MVYTRIERVWSRSNKIDIWLDRCNRTIECSYCGEDIVNDDIEPASPVLLVKAGSGVSSSASSYRDKRQKKYGFASRTKSSKTKDTAKEGKNNTGNSRGDRQASASSKHR